MALPHGDYGDARHRETFAVAPRRANGTFGMSSGLIDWADASFDVSTQSDRTSSISYVHESVWLLKSTVRFTSINATMMLCATTISLRLATQYCVFQTSRFSRVWMTS